MWFCNRSNTGWRYGMIVERAILKELTMLLQAKIYSVLDDRTIHQTINEVIDMYIRLGANKNLLKLDLIKTGQNDLQLLGKNFYTALWLSGIIAFEPDNNREEIFLDDRTTVSPHIKYIDGERYVGLDFKETIEFKI